MREELGEGGGEVVTGVEGEEECGTPRGSHPPRPMPKEE